MPMPPRTNSAAAEKKRQSEAGPTDTPQAPPASPSYQSVTTKRKRSQEAEAVELEGVHLSKKSRRLSSFTHLADSVPEADEPEGAHHSKGSQKLSPQSRNCQPAGTKWKRSQDVARADETEGVRLSKRSFQTPPSEYKLSKENSEEGSVLKANELEGVHDPEEPQELLPSKDQLSKENLRTLEILSRKDMDPAFNNLPPLKRTSSRRSIALSEAGTDRTQRSSSTTAVYRHKHLVAAQIHIHVEPPGYVKAAVNRIVNAPVSEDRRAELRIISQQFRDGCFKNVQAQAGEDDFIDPLHTALKALGLKNMCLHEKADWREELKPVVHRQSHFSSSFMAGVQQLDTLAPPRKRQQQFTSEPYISPESSISDAPAQSPVNHPQESSTMPPPAPHAQDRSVKTPRPDISIGLQLTALISALSQNLNKVQAKQFLEWLQNETVQREELEPLLISVPALRALDLAFPFAVVEGKAYSTGKQIFEAENQAAVAGACGLKIQLDLEDLVDHAMTSSDATCSITEPLLFFSITTQGPIHELWVHWTVVEYNVRMFNSKLLKSCNALLLERGEDFIVGLNNVGLWGTGPFMKSVVGRLGKVASKAKV